MINLGNNGNNYVYFKGDAKISIGEEIVDLSLLKQYRQYGKCLTETDRRRLEKIGEEKEFGEVIGFMLEENIKLEQECII